MKKLLLVLSFCLVVITAQAQELPFDYVVNRGEQSITWFEGREFVGNLYSTYLVQGWNPSGRYFMHYYDDPNQQSDVLLLNDNRTPEAFSYSNRDIIVGANYPAYFGDERLLFIELTQNMLVSEDEQGLSVMRFNLYEWLFDESINVTQIGTIPYGVGCGGSGIRSAIDIVYSNEVNGDTSGEYNRKVLAPTPYGIVHVNSCTAIRTYLTNPETTEFVELSDNLRWATVSPDSQWVTGTNGNILEIINLETMEIIPVFEPDAPVYSVTWLDDSSGFYYVMRETNGQPLPVDDPDNVLATVEETLYGNAPDPEDLLQWTTSIYRYDIEENVSIEMYRADAYAIGSMTWIDDTLVFNQIEYPTTWLQAIVDGGNPYDSNLIPVTLMQLDVNSGEATTLGDNFRGIWVRPQ